ncbi:hypothetical protein C8Q80DRAFT_1185950 [Daedaleopsis nitida]|nr:hypothetical protein C8Q80DRAFT_1185950 [Daedaleopsis nitida]
MVAASIDNTLGAVFIGNLCVVCLYGLTTLQTYMYYSRSKNDAILLKSAIAVLWVLDTLHVILTSHTVYFYSITHFGDVEALTKITWCAVVYILVTAISDSIVRAVFCYRIWILSNGNKVLFGANVFLSALLLADEIALVSNLFHIPTFAGLQKINWLFLMGLASGVVADVFIAGTLTMLLVKSRGHYHR